MSPRPLLLAVLALTLAAGCGAEPTSDTGSFGWELLVDKAVADDVSAFQIVVLPNSKQRDCTEIQKTCLRLQVNTSEALVLKDSQGTEGRALRFPVSLSGTSGSLQQDVSIEVPVGQDYVLVIEALSKSSPPRFLGSSCNFLPEVHASRNDPLLAAPMTISPTTAVDCDPTI